jgi:hypothetical protein
VNPSWPHGDPREVARSVLTDPRFHAAAHGPAPKQWWDYVLDGVRWLLERVFGSLGRFVGSEAVTTIVGVAILIVVMGLLLVVVMRFADRFGGPGRGRLLLATDATALDADADARTLRARAAAAAAQGRYRDAAVLLWLSALRALDERGRVRYDPSRTPGEWRRAVRDTAFDALARDATVALFAGDGADAELVARMSTAYDRVVPA